MTASSSERQDVPRDTRAEAAADEIERAPSGRDDALRPAKALERGTSPATPFLAIGHVGLAIGVVFALVCAIALMLYLFL